MDEPASAPKPMKTLAQLAAEAAGASQGECKFCGCCDFRLISKRSDGGVTECCRNCKRGVRIRYD